MALARGYDVSDYQSSIPDDAQFVFVKATEGARTSQQGYPAKLADARNRSLVVGHYHFLHCENPVQGEIDHFCQVVGAVPAGELLVLDFEPYGQPVSDAEATAAKNAWLAAVRARYPNNRVGLYTSVDWWRRTDDECGDFLWIADYVQAGSPRIQAAWRFHQWADSPLDSDVYNGSVDDLRAWVGGSTPASLPAPVVAGPWTSPGRVTRAQWGAVAPSGSYTPMTGALGVKIHYLGEAYQFSDHSTCAAYVRKVQAAHMVDPNEHWVDIAYNELVCEHGYRFEGRGHNVRSGANGDQTLNARHYAVCALLGSIGSTAPTDAQLNGLRDAIEDYQTNAAAGPEIRGHRDGYSTDCPGDPLYAWVQAGAPRPQEDDMPLNDADKAAIADLIRNTVRSGPPSDRDAYAVANFLAYSFAGQVPPGGDSGVAQMAGWLHQTTQTCMGAVVDDRLTAFNLEQKIADAVAAAVGPAVAQALASGITLTVNTTPKGN